MPAAAFRPTHALAGVHRFARVRVRAAHRDHQRTERRTQRRTERRAGKWLLTEWPEGHKEPMKYWLFTPGQDVPLQRLVF